jgi:hypothetical protein
MTENQSQTPPPRPTAPATSISVGGSIMVFFGALLLIFPGGCGLVGLGSVLADMATGPRGRGGDLDLTGLVVVMSLLGLGIAVIGFFLIRWGLRRRVPERPPTA